MKCQRQVELLPLKNLPLSVNALILSLQNAERGINVGIDSQIAIICEDDWYRVISKPQGLATMGPKGTTLLKSDFMLLPDAIKLQLSYKKAVPCHRLDKETGGIMLCSKSKLAERTIMACFRNKLVQKKYLAIVVGKLEPLEGTVSTPISGKPALTRYSVVSHTPSAQYGWLSTVQLWPITGKQHQLRRHMQSVGHAIVNDKRFSLPQLWDHVVKTDISSMFLWAVEITFPHPMHCTELCDGPAALASQADVGALDSDCDEEDDVDEQDATGADDSKSEAVNAASAAVKRIRALPPDCRVTASIPEPAYYATFRDIHQRAWVEASATIADEV